MLRIEVELTLEPRLARLRYVLTVLLGGVERPFLRVMRWRARKRDRLLVLEVTPCSAKASRSSDSTMLPRFSHSLRIREA